MKLLNFLFSGKKQIQIFRLLFLLMFGILFVVIFQGSTYKPSSSGNSNSSSGSTMLKPDVKEQVIISNKIQATIESTFIGFSYEKSILSIPLFTSSNQSLINLFKLLGPGILRIGGNTVNQTSWDSAGPGLTSKFTAPPDIDRLTGFLQAVNWKVIYGLNGTTSSPALSCSEALYAASKLGNFLYGFEIGNEPDLYYKNGLEFPTFSFSDFITLWNSYYSLIIAQNYQVAFSGPASATNYSSYTVPFAKMENKKINLLTHHYYRANGKSSISTIDLLLAPDPNLPAILTALQNASVSNNIAEGYRLAEANSFYNGGAPGVSNAFGSALWAIEFCFNLAKYGAKGVNFHGGGKNSGYTLIANDSKGNILDVRPEYYGIFLFSLVANGNVLTTQNMGSATGLYSYAISENDGSTAVILVNNSRTEIISATVNLPVVFNSATSMYLTASSIDAVTGITLGGSAIKSDGSWNPNSSNVKLNGKSFKIVIPSGSAVWVKLLK